MKTPVALFALIVILAILLIIDLTGLVAGERLAADCYYLPLMRMNLGELEKPVVESIIKTSYELENRRRHIWLVAHGLAFGLSLLVLRKIRHAESLGKAAVP